MADATGLSTVADKGSDVARRTGIGAARQASDAAGRAGQMPRAVRIAALAVLVCIAAAVVRRLTAGASKQDDGGTTGNPDATSPQTPQRPSGVPDPAEYTSPPAAPPRPGDNVGQGEPGPPNEFPSQSGGPAA